MARRRWAVAAAVATAAVAAIVVAVKPLEKDRRADGARQGALLDDDWRVRLVSPQVAEHIAAREYAAAVEQFSAAGTLDDDPYLTELVASVAEPLILAARDLYPQTRDWPWEWHVAGAEDINAWCLPGGRIMVLAGLLAPEILDDDRDRLATVLAHEVAHAILQHSRESLGRAQVAQGLAWTVAKGLKIGAVREGQMVRTLKTALLDPTTRARETEADVLGLELMTRAGFAPDKAVETWERMARRLPADARTPLVQRALAFLSDHPSDLERLERLRALQPKARPLAEGARQWDWLVHGIDDAQADALSRAANMFGLDRLDLGGDGTLVRAVAEAEGTSARHAATEVERAMWESALDQGGALQMGLAAMVRGAGGWERLARMERAWKKLRQPRPLLEAPEQVARMALSAEDRAAAVQSLRQVRAYLASPRMHRRLWRDAAEELGKTMPRGRDAILQRIGAQEDPA